MEIEVVGAARGGGEHHHRVAPLVAPDLADGIVVEAGEPGEVAAGDVAHPDPVAEVAGQLRPERPGDANVLAGVFDADMGQGGTGGVDVLVQLLLAVGQDEQRQAVRPHHEAVGHEVVQRRRNVSNLRFRDIPCIDHSGLLP